MDPNKVYCHGSSSHHRQQQQQQPHQHHQQSQQQQQHIAPSSSSSTSSVPSQQQQQQQQYGNELVHAKGNGSSSSNNNNNNKTHLNSTTAGNYINVVPVPIGVQYHRRKLTPQDYQPRVYYSSSDYRCREDFYSIGSAAGVITSPTQQQHQHQHQHHDVVEQALINSRVVATQTNNNNNNNISNNNNNSIISNNSNNNSCDQQILSAVSNNGNGNNNLNNNNTNNSNNNGGCGTPVQPPVLYTVHRVVTTAQIQTAGGNTFAASSSVSSVVSSVRGENDCGLIQQQQQQQQTSGTSGLQIQGASSSTGLHSSPGISTNSNYQQQQQQQQPSCSQDVQPSSSLATNYNSSTASTSSNYSNGAKSSTSIPRPLQNVIPTCVYLMSRIAVHMEIEGTAQCPAQVMLAAALGCEELGIANKLLAQSIFGLWMTSVLLEIQLKSQHRPYVVRVAWPHLLDKFSHGNPIEKRFDEPMIVLKRNVFFSKKDEEKIKDHRIIELLYEEAKHNVLAGRYIMEPVHSIMLGGIQARIELGPYNSHTHTISYFRENQSRFLPQHVAKSSNWSWLPVSRKNSAEVKLLEQFKRVPQSTTTRKLMRKYLEFCWALPFYGASFFHGQVEQPVRGLMSLVNHKDISVIVAINERGVYIIDPEECTLLLGLRYEDLSWDYAKPSSNDDPDCQTCIFLQFDAVENGIPVSKLMQIFSRQAGMMDALIAHFAEQMRRRREGAADGQPVEHVHDEPNPIQNNGNGVLCNKLSRLTLATFEDEGRCIGQMGSLSISY